MGDDLDTPTTPTTEDAELAAETVELYKRIFEPRKRELRKGSATPSEHQIAQYYRELESIEAAHQQAEAQSAGLLVG